MKLNSEIILRFACYMAVAVYCSHIFVPGLDFENGSGIPPQPDFYADTKANSALNEFATKFRFTMNTSRLQKKSIETPKVKLSGINWSVLFLVKNYNIDVHLLPHFESESPESVEVQSSYKLLERIDRKDKSFTKHLSKHLVEKNSAHALIIQKYVNWNDFKSNYEYGQKATFEIEIITNPIHRKDLTPPHGLDVMTKKILVELQNLKNMEKQIASEFELRGIKWIIHTEKKNGSLGFNLTANENDLNRLSWNVHATFTLLSFNKNVEPIQHTFTHNCNLASPVRGIEKFVSWTIPAKKFVTNDKANLVVDIQVDNAEQVWNL